MCEEYSDEYALDLQARARFGDMDSCEALFALIKPASRAVAHDCRVDFHTWEDIWHDTVIVFAQRIASGHPVLKWRAWGRAVARNMIKRHQRDEIIRERKEKAYMKRLCKKYTEAYPAVRSAVNELEPMHNELIHRLYFRPQRQSMVDFSIEFGENYWRVYRLHKLVLGILREKLISMGITHA